MNCSHVLCGEYVGFEEVNRNRLQRPRPGLLPMCPIFVGVDLAKETLDVGLRPSVEGWSVTNEEAWDDEPAAAPPRLMHVQGCSVL